MIHQLRYLAIDLDKAVGKFHRVGSGIANTLDTINWEAKRAKARTISYMIEQLSDFLRLSLNNGSEMPLVGLGTFAAELGGECREAVKTAILCGYRCILKNKSYTSLKGK